MSEAPLPPAIVAAGEALVLALSTYATTHPEVSLATLEDAVLATVRTALPDLLHAVLQTTLRSRTTLPARCPQCQHRAMIHDWRTRQVLTTCGLLRWERPWATCTTCGLRFGAGDATLGLAPDQRHSAGVQALVTALGSATTFREATRLLAQTTGLVLGRETVRRDTEAAGTALADAQAAAAARYAAGTEPAVVDAAPGALAAETDGVMVRYAEGWHEVKLGVVGGWEATPDPAPDAPAGHLLRPSYVAAREDSSAFAQRFGAEVARRGGLAVVGWHGPHQGVAALRCVIVLGDGAKWIWVTVADQFGTVIEIVDFYHACEHLTTVAGLLYGVDSAKATAWAAEQRDTLLTQGVEALLSQLTPPADVVLSDDAREKLRAEAGYFRGNQTRMRYPAFREQGLPIGSGAVESSAKHLIQQRLKRAGMRWSDAGGRALIALRADQATQFGLAA